ncbi:MAG: hypothetical protein ACI910_000218 [Oleispira sp.]|jgi:hypothetical protein
MNLRFSRSSLNLIIFACIILIGWASIDANIDKLRSEGSLTTEAIDLPALSELHHQSWSSHEGIQIFWQTRLDTDFQIRVRGQLPDQGNLETTIDNHVIASGFISWQQDHWQWDINMGDDFELGLKKLSQHINDFPSPLKGQPATIILQGPWSAGIARLISARLIKSLTLKPLNSFADSSTMNRAELNKTEIAPAELYLCPWQPVSAQYWLQDQLSSAHQSRPNIDAKQWLISPWPKLPPISEQSLRIWKQTFVQQWQLKWQNPATQFDILSDLAYYRLPQNYLLEGYWGINTLDVDQLGKYLSQCQIQESILEPVLEPVLESEPAEHSGSITHGEKEKQQ